MMRSPLVIPALVSDGRPAQGAIESRGAAGLNFDYEKTFGKPVRFINDAAMQALASYATGRMLFLGFGTSIGATVIVDDVILPFEIGMLRLTRRAHFMDRLCKAAFKRDGRKLWLRSAYDVIRDDAGRFQAGRYPVLGESGNASQIDPLPAEGVAGCATIRRHLRAPRAFGPALI